MKETILCDGRNCEFRFGIRDKLGKEIIKEKKLKIGKNRLPHDVK